MPNANPGDNWSKDSIGSKPIHENFTQPHERLLNRVKINIPKRGLKPYALKGARTVSRGGSDSNGTSLLGKVDAYPGRLNQVSVYINREGVFYGQCSEICGILHSSMPIVIEAVSLEKFLL